MQGLVRRGILDRFEGEAGHVRELFILKQRCQHRHGLCGADACQFPAGGGFFLMGRFGPEDIEKRRFFAGEKRAGKQDERGEKGFHGWVWAWREIRTCRGRASRGGTAGWPRGLRRTPS
jgi:hypothetical protein